MNGRRPTTRHEDEVAGDLPARRHGAIGPDPSGPHAGDAQPTGRAGDGCRGLWGAGLHAQPRSLALRLRSEIGYQRDFDAGLVEIEGRLVGRVRCREYDGT